jgi:hypothetical protein
MRFFKNFILFFLFLPYINAWAILLYILLTYNAEGFALPLFMRIFASFWYPLYASLFAVALFSPVLLINSLFVSLIMMFVEKFLPRKPRLTSDGFRKGFEQSHIGFCRGEPCGSSSVKDNERTPKDLRKASKTQSRFSRLIRLLITLADGVLLSHFFLPLLFSEFECAVLQIFMVLPLTAFSFCLFDYFFLRKPDNPRIPPIIPYASGRGGEENRERKNDKDGNQNENHAPRENGGENHI